MTCWHVACKNNNVVSSAKFNYERDDIAPNEVSFQTPNILSSNEVRKTCALYWDGTGETTELTNLLYRINHYFVRTVCNLVCLVLLSVGDWS